RGRAFSRGGTAGRLPVPSRGGSFFLLLLWPPVGSGGHVREVSLYGRGQERGLPKDAAAAAHRVPHARPAEPAGTGVPAALGRTKAVPAPPGAGAGPEPAGLDLA